MLVAGALIDAREIMQALLEIATDEEKKRILARVVDVTPDSALTALRSDDDTDALVHRALHALLRKKMDEDLYGVGLHIMP